MTEKYYSESFDAEATNVSETLHHQTGPYSLANHTLKKHKKTNNPKKPGIQRKRLYNFIYYNKEVIRKGKKNKYKSTKKREPSSLF
jgi:hypothetical protein